MCLFAEHCISIERILCTARPVLIMCRQCDWTSRSAAGIRRHCNTVHGGVRFRCDLCPVKVRSESSLQNHKDRIHGDSWNIPVPCDQCDYKANTSKILRVHMVRVHETKYKKTFPVVCVTKSLLVCGGSNSTKNIYMMK